MEGSFQIAYIQVNTEFGVIPDRTRIHLNRGIDSISLQCAVTYILNCFPNGTRCDLMCLSHAIVHGYHDTYLLEKLLSKCGCQIKSDRKIQTRNSGISRVSRIDYTRTDQLQYTLANLYNPKESSTGIVQHYCNDLRGTSIKIRNNQYHGYRPLLNNHAPPPIAPVREGQLLFPPDAVGKQGLGRVDAQPAQLHLRRLPPARLRRDEASPVVGDPDPIRGPALRVPPLAPRVRHAVPLRPRHRAPPHRRAAQHSQLLNLGAVLPHARRPQHVQQGGERHASPMCR
jgi:hypothetical protein